MQLKNFVCAVLFTVIFFAGCSRGLDKEKFENARRTARSVNLAATSGANYEQFDKSVSRLSGEISLLKTRMSSDRERELLKKYADLLGIYQDGLLLWKYKLEGAHYGFIPQEVIYVGQDVEPVAEKYSLPTESHVYGPTKQIWRSIPGDSLRIIWDNADAQLKIIDYFTNE
jgi:hypothetical protein